MTFFHFFPSTRDTVAFLLEQIDFDKPLMQGMLCFLLYAGALQINLNDLAERKTVVGALALAGVAVSMFVFATLICYISGWLKVELSYVWCLLFGSLISPAEPLAVLGILKAAKVPKASKSR